jgi:hypothetical protein
MNYKLKAQSRENCWNFFPDHENFYDGRLFGEVSSEASVHLEDGVMTATIHAPEETYHIEVIKVCLS